MHTQSFKEMHVWKYFDRIMCAVLSRPIAGGSLSIELQRQRGIWFCGFLLYNVVAGIYGTYNLPSLKRKHGLKCAERKWQEILTGLKWILNDVSRELWVSSHTDSSWTRSRGTQKPHRSGNMFWILDGEIKICNELLRVEKCGHLLHGFGLGFLCTVKLILKLSFLFSGLIRCTSCLASFSWSLSFSWSPVQKLQFCCVISICALR